MECPVAEWVVFSVIRQQGVVTLVVTTTTIPPTTPTPSPLIQISPQAIITTIDIHHRQIFSCTLSPSPEISADWFFLQVLS